MTTHSKPPAHGHGTHHGTAGHKPTATPTTTIHIKVRNRLRHEDHVSGATVELVGSGVPPASVKATTNAHGVATLDLKSLPPGSYTLRVTPAHTSSDPVGPAIAKTAPVPDRIYRSLEATANVLSNKIKSATVLAAQVKNGTLTIGNDPNVTVDLQPVWMASPFHHSRGGTALDVVDLIVVHHTAGDRIQGTLNWFLGLSKGANAHYVIDTDGQIVKMVQDDLASNHAGVSFWDGVNGVNDTSIGIETVNKSGPYTAAQYTALLDLLQQLTKAFAIDQHRIVGHSDIAHNGKDEHGKLVRPLFVLGRKSSDPGLEFEWTRLEAKGLGMVPNGASLPATAYGGFFTTFPSESLQRHDNDKHHKFGGKVRTSFKGTPVQELQEDLKAIGYSVGTPDGDFGQKAEAAVEMFQEHFFGGTRKRGIKPNGKVDKATAEMIKQVRP